MPRRRNILVASVGGIAAAAAILLLVLVPRSENRASATAGTRPTFVTLLSGGANSRLADTTVEQRLHLEPASSAAGIASDVARLDADGVILDEVTVRELPEGGLASLFAAGRVLVVFGVEKQDVLRLAASDRAFPDADIRYIPEVTLNPGSPTGSYRSPFFSVVFRTRPGLSKIGGGETTREYAPAVFAGLLAERASNARGVTILPPGSNTGNGAR